MGQRYDDRWPTSARHRREKNNSAWFVQAPSIANNLAAIQAELERRGVSFVDQDENGTRLQAGLRRGGDAVSEPRPKTSPT